MNGQEQEKKFRDQLLKEENQNLVRNVKITGPI
jgi:hypothetical protein